MNKTAITTIFVTAIMLIASTVLVSIETNAQTTNDDNDLRVNGLFYYDSKRYVVKTLDINGKFITGDEFNKVDLIFITDQNPNDANNGIIKIIAYNNSEIVFEDKTDFKIENNELFIKENEVWINPESIQNESRVFQFIAAGLAALLAYLLTPELLAVIGTILGAGVVYITYQELKEEIHKVIEEIFPDETPESITTEYKLPGDVTIFLIDGVPAIVHWGETDEASNLQDFTYEVREGLDPGFKFYLVCKIDDVMMISPIAFDKRTAEKIIEEDSPIYHIWTLSSYNATEVTSVTSTAECHMFPFEIMACDVHYAHWHNFETSLGVDYYSNSMVFFGLEYNAQDDDTYPEEEDQR